MKNSADSNIYEVNALSVLNAYEDLIEGDTNSSVLVISAKPLSSQARKALEKSAEYLGYLSDAIAWALTALPDAALSLGTRDLHLLVEGLDPLFVIATDASSGELLGQAYGVKIAPDTLNRVLGRSVLCLKDFEGSLKNEDAKQRAWHLLKQLPKRSLG